MIGRAFSLGAPVLSRMDAERAHALTLAMLQAVPLPGAPKDDPSLAVTAFGLRFPNPIGLAAGFDKNAEVVDPMLRLGFGFVEVGSLTPLARRTEIPAPSVSPRGGRRRHQPSGLQQSRPCRGACARLAGRKGDRHRRRQRRRQQGQRRQGAPTTSLASRASPRSPPTSRSTSPPRTRRGCATCRSARPSTTSWRGRSGRGTRPRGVIRGARSSSRSRRTSASRSSTTWSRWRWRGVSTAWWSATRPCRGRTACRERRGRRSRRPVGRAALRALDTDAARDGDARRGALPLVGVGGINSAETARAKLEAGATLVQLYSGLVFQGPGLIARDQAGACRRALRWSCGIRRGWRCHPHLVPLLSRGRRAS